MSDPGESLDLQGLRVLPCSILSTQAGRIWVARGGGSGGSVPPKHVGPRTTQILSRRGARALQDASYLAFLSGQGFCTHWTFTMTDTARDALRDGEMVLSREIRRTLNAVQTRLAREGRPPMRYQWVAENPDRSHGVGGTNPHVHLNCDLTVPQRDFEAWAGWVEAVWSHGMVHQERLKDPRAAAAYLLKCVGYVSKGKQWGQGEIKGARYGVSKGLRPVSERWECDDSDGRIAQGLRVVCAETPAKGVVQLGRGVFATRHGVGCNPLSGATVPDVVRLLRRRGNWILPEVVANTDPHFAWCREYRKTTRGLRSLGAVCDAPEPVRGPNGFYSSTTTRGPEFVGPRHLSDHDQWVAECNASTAAILAGAVAVGAPF